MMVSVCALRAGGESFLTFCNSASGDGECMKCSYSDEAYSPDSKFYTR